MKYTTDFITSVLQYAKDNGSTKAAKHFQIQYSTIRRWNEKYNIYIPQRIREFSEQQKIEILKYANEHGLTSAMREYDIDISTMRTWNEKLGIYQQTGRRKEATHKKTLTHECKEFKLTVLAFAKEHGISKTARKYKLPYSTIRSWNNIYKVYTTRKKRKFSDAQKKIIVKYATENTISAAAHIYNVSCDQIQQWANALQK